MAKPRRIETGESLVHGWSLKSYIWEDAESGSLIGYNHHFQRNTPSGFVGFVRLDLHRRGVPSEDAPHVHIRLESKRVPRSDESLEVFSKVLDEIPRIERVVK